MNERHRGEKKWLNLYRPSNRGLLPFSHLVLLLLALIVTTTNKILATEVAFARYLYLDTGFKT
jgi:hypothetical protein